MIVVICLLIGLVIGIVMAVRIGFNLIDYIALPALWAFCGLIAGCFALVIGQTMIRDMPIDETNIIYTNCTEIIALKDSLGFDGPDYVIPTHVKGELKYLYVYNAGETGNAVDYLDANKVYIRYLEENETAYFRTWMKEPKNKILKCLFINDGVEHYTLYLPKSSVIEGIYKIDLE